MGSRFEFGGENTTLAHQVWLARQVETSGCSCAMVAIGEEEPQQYVKL